MLSISSTLQLQARRPVVQCFPGTVLGRASRCRFMLGAGLEKLFPARTERGEVRCGGVGLRLCVYPPAWLQRSLASRAMASGDASWDVSGARGSGRIMLLFGVDELMTGFLSWLRGRAVAQGEDAIGGLPV